MSLRKLTRAHLQLSSEHALVQGSRDLLSEVAAALAAALSLDLSAEARLIPAAREIPSRFPSTSLVASVDLGLSDLPALMELDLDFAVALASGLAGQRSKPAPVSTLTRLEEATLGYLLLTALRPIRTASGWPGLLCPRLSIFALGGTSPAAAHGPYVVVEVDLSLGAQRGTVRCWLPSSALVRAWNEREGRQEPNGSTENPPDWELPVRCTLSPVELDTADFEALAPRDVVLLGISADTAKGSVRTATFALPGNFSARGFELSAQPLVQPTSLESRFMTPSTSALDPLRIELEVELTRRSLTLTQLASLGPGAILPLQLNLSEPVVLRVGERIVGTAELVDIEGEVGARILTLIR